MPTGTSGLGMTHSASPPFEIGVVRHHPGAHGARHGQERTLARNSARRGQGGRRNVRAQPAADRQAVVESYFNYDAFRGIPIDERGGPRSAGEARYNEQTSLMMRELESPGYVTQKLEHLLIGYTGTMGSYVMAAADG